LVLLGFCDSCNAFLDSKCATARSSGNITLCLACARNKSLAPLAAYSGCSKYATTGFCGVPTPAPPTPRPEPTPVPVHCNWGF
jgi:hypothetical protein